jgi:ABC-type amino acid transport substrate-binding protein
MARSFTVFLVVLGIAIQANGQELTGTLKRVADTGEFRIGYVPDAPPLSFHDDDGTPTGYSIALCRNVANAVKKAVGLDEIKLSYVPLILPEDRINAVVNHDVDIECGATTVTLSRREQVDFSLMTFITGGAVLSLTGDSINSVAELSERTVAVIRGTTTHAAIRDFITTNDFKITLRMINTHDEGMELLNAGKVGRLCVGSHDACRTGGSLEKPVPLLYYPRCLFVRALCIDAGTRRHGFSTRGRPCTGQSLQHRKDPPPVP